jgi:hypothetical protein
VRINVVHAIPVLAALLVLGGCESSKPKPATPPRVERAQISEELVGTMEVVAIENPARILMLRREDGRSFRVRAGKDVRNYDQIAVGDRLRVRYQETLTASLRPAGENAGPVEGVLAAGRAEPGATPAAGVGLALSVRVKIVSVDVERDIVVFSLASGEMVAHKIATPQGREFAKGLKIGDTVQLDYTEVLAVSIEKL